MAGMIAGRHPVDSKRILYTPSAFARENLLHLQETGELQARAARTSRRSGLASYLFFIVLSGTGTLNYEAGQHALQRGDCVFIDCKKPYAHSTGKDLWSLQWAHFNGPAMRGIYEKYIGRGGSCVFHARDTQLFTSLLTSLYSVATSTDSVRDMRINELLSRLLVHLMAASRQSTEDIKPATDHDVLLAVKNHLDEHFASPITLDTLADRFYINKYHLARLFKERHGVSIVNYAMLLRVSRAKELLRFTSLPMAKIGEACGLSDSNYFSRVFRKVEGVSPSVYRKQW